MMPLTKYEEARIAEEMQTLDPEDRSGFTAQDALIDNVFGTHNVAQAADKYEVKWAAMILSDKAVNPVSVMGMTKRLAQMAV